MTRTSKLILWLLCGFATLVFIAIAVFVVWRVRLAHDVENRLAALRKAGMPTSGEELNKWYTSVPDSENAALVMTQAFALMRNYPDGRSNEVANFKIPPRGQSLTAEQKRLLSGYVEMNAVALAKAREAIKLTKSRYPVDLTPNQDALLPHLPNLRKVSELAGFETVSTLQARDSKQAADVISFQIALGHTLDTEPLLVSQLVRGGIFSTASQLAEYTLNHITLDKATLLNLENDFVRVDENGISSIGFVSDRAMFLPCFRTNWHAIRRIIYLMSDSGPSLSIEFRGRFGRLTGLFDRDEKFYLEAMQAAIDGTKQPFPQRLLLYLTMRETALKGDQRGYILGPSILNGLRNVLPKEAKMSAHVRLAITALAVERFRLVHGQLPGNLNGLTPQFLSAVPTDPFDGAPLRYRRLAKGYVVYSVGSDGHDDGGREKPADWKSTNKTTYDITFTVER